MIETAPTGIDPMDLNAPLDRKPQRQRSMFVVGALTGTAVLGIGLLGVVLYRADPRGGEPFAVAAIPPVLVPGPAAPASRGEIDPSPTGSVAPGPLPNDSRIENGVRVTSPTSSDRSSSPDRLASRDTGPQIIDVSKALDGSERRTGNLDRGTSTSNSFGGKSFDTNAFAVKPAAVRPRVAIFVGGMGLNETSTRTAIELMPAAVTFAFPPYGTSLGQSVAAARGKGHEIMLQLPMQSSSGGTPGPHALHLGEPLPEMEADLDWAMGRVDGYSGVTNLLGAGVTADPAAMTAILARVGKRGLFYVDDGTSKRSQAVSLAASQNVPATGVDVVLDATSDPAMVRANLDRLVAIAKAKGVAVGMASGLSDDLQLVARFASELDGRGITLVPVGSVARGGANIATNR